jgi:hypothetical protein
VSGASGAASEELTILYSCFWLAVRVLCVTYNEGAAVSGMLDSIPKLLFFFRLLRVRLSELTASSIGISITGLESGGCCAELDGRPCLSPLIGGVASGKAYGSWVSGRALGVASCSKLSCALLRFPYVRVAFCDLVDVGTSHTSLVPLAASFLGVVMSVKSITSAWRASRVLFDLRLGGAGSVTNVRDEESFSWDFCPGGGADETSVHAERAGSAGAVSGMTTCVSLEV